MDKLDTMMNMLQQHINQSNSNHIELKVQNAKLETEMIAVKSCMTDQSVVNTATNKRVKSLEDSRSFQKGFTYAVSFIGGAFIIDLLKRIFT